MPSEPTPLAIRSLSHLLLLVALGFTGLFVLGFLTTLPDRLGALVPLSAVEPQPVVGALRVARGEPLYRDYLAELPVVPLTYGALEYQVVGRIARVFRGDSPSGVLLAGRWVTSLSALASLALLAVLARQRGAPWRWAVLAGLPVFWFPYMAEWLVKFTPDTLALTFSLAGWVLAGAPTQDRSRLRANLRLAGAVALWIAVYHLKLIVLIGPAGFAVERLHVAYMKRSGKPLLPVLAAGGAVAAGVLLTSLLANRLTAGLWQLHVIDSVADCRFQLAYTVRSLTSFSPASFLGRGAPTILGGLGVYSLMAIWAALRVRRQPLYLLFLGLLALNLVFLAKQGANINYLLGATLAWGLAATLDLTGGASRPIGRVEIALAATALLLIGLDLPAAPRITKEISLPTEKEFARADQLRTQLGEENVLVADAVYGVLREAPVLWADSYHASLLYENGTSAFDSVFARIEDGQYDLVITGRFAFYGSAANYHDVPVSPRGLWMALRQSYRPIPPEQSSSDWLVFWIRAPRQE